MKSWFGRHAEELQAVATTVTALVAVAALIGVKVQIDRADRIQREASAREIYREFLNLSIAWPEFAEPDYCAIRGTPQEPAYEAFVGYMLYSTEQLVAVLPEWKPTMAEHLGTHRELLCSESDWSGETPDVRKLIDKFRAGECEAFKPACG